MRTRTEIEVAVKDHAGEAQSAIIELLLDIRDLQVTANKLGRRLTRMNRTLE